MNNLTIGEKIAQYRRLNNLTIKDFAKQTGLSSALLSQLERNIGNPTLFALTSIAEALNITVSELVEHKVENASLICRKENQTARMNSKNGQVMYNVLACKNAKSNLDLMLMTLAPNSKTEGGYSVHKSEEEIAFILEGSVTIKFVNEEFILHKEDSIRILPGRGHLFYNHTNSTSKVLFALYRH